MPLDYYDKQEIERRIENAHEKTRGEVRAESRKMQR